MGASDIVHINISEKWNFLAVANFYDGYTTKLYSTLYHIQSSDFIPYQYLETRGAFDIEFFKIGQKSFLAVANAEDVGSEALHGRYTLNSTIYEFDDLTKKFVVFQEIRTLSCLDMEYFEFGRDHYLIVVNHYDEGLSPGRTGDGRYDVKADVYKWRAVEGFKLEHSIQDGWVAFFGFENLTFLQLFFGVFGHFHAFFVFSAGSKILCLRTPIHFVVTLLCVY